MCIFCNRRQDTHTALARILCSLWLYISISRFFSLTHSSLCRTAADEAEDDTEFEADDLEQEMRVKFGTAENKGEGAMRGQHYWEATKTGTYVDGVVRYGCATGGAAERPVKAGVANYVRTFEGAGPRAGFTLQRGMTLLHHACRKGNPIEVRCAVIVYVIPTALQHTCNATNATPQTCERRM
jgi:hypothetical protein